MLKTEKDFAQLINKICKARGNLKVNEGLGFKYVEANELERIVLGLKIGIYKLVGYSEKSVGCVPYELSISVR